MKGAADTYQGRGLIADPIHQYILYTRPGGIPGEATEQDIIDTPWAQRLRRIPQLQSARWGFPAAGPARDRKGAGWGKREDLGGGRLIKKKKRMQGVERENCDRYVEGRQSRCYGR